MAVFSERMLPEVMDRFWGALARGEFITQARPCSHLRAGSGCTSCRTRRGTPAHRLSEHAHPSRRARPNVTQAAPTSLGLPYAWPQKQ
jgi:hypothetical protein